MCRLVRTSTVCGQACCRERNAGGGDALFADKGGSNLALGSNALKANTTGASNIAIGVGAGVNLTTGSSNIDIANHGIAGDSKRIRIGTPGTQTTAFLAGINGVTIPGPTKTVVVNSSGQLGTAPAGSAHAAVSDQGGLSATVRRQQQQINQLKAEIAQLRGLILHPH